MANIQKPCKEILCGIGREHCKLVMNELTLMLQPHTIGHFMVLETLGMLTRSNLDDCVGYIKTILGTIIPMLSLIKHDYQKQSYGNAIQNFCDTTIEFQSNIDRKSTNSQLSNEVDLTASEEEAEVADDETKILTSKNIDISTEVGIIYDVFMQQWIGTRDAKLCSEFLVTLSYIYPLLPVNKILDNTAKIIHTLLMMYKRSIDRASATIFLNSVIQTTSRIDGKLLETQVDSVIATIFDLVVSNPDFEKPVTVRSHNEVLRCYDLLSKNFGERVVDLLLVKFKANDDRDKIKALILLTHLTNTNGNVIKMKVNEFIEILRVMVMNEKSFKIKQIILRAIVAFAQKGFIMRKIFIKFIIHHCCHLLKVLQENGTHEEAAELVRSCNNTLIILSREITNGLEKLLKVEILQMLMHYEYTDAATTFLKCLTALYQRDDHAMSTSEDDETESEKSNDNKNLPSPESIFVRSLVLLANYEDKERIRAVLDFLIVFCPQLSGKHLQTLWTEKINELRDVLKINDDDKFYKDIFLFIMATIKDIDDPKFSESLVNKMADQFVLYQSHNSQHIHPTNLHQLNTEVIVPNLRLERGMLMKILGLCLCYVTDIPSIDTKIDLIITQVKIEKLEKVVNYAELEEKFYDPAKALGFVSKAHYDLLMKKFENIIADDSLKKSSSFLSFNFTKDAQQKEAEKYKLKILIIFSYHFIVQFTSPSNIIKSNEEQNDKVIEYLNRNTNELRECQLKKVILITLLKITDIYISEQKNDFKFINDILSSILNIPLENTIASSGGINNGNYGFYDYLPLYPTILKLATNLIKLSPISSGNLDGTNLLDISSQHFFTAAQNLNLDDEVIIKQFQINLF